jgi:hypothetical protein
MRGTLFTCWALAVAVNAIHTTATVIAQRCCIFLLSILLASFALSLEHPVRPRQHVRRNSDADFLSGR